MIPLMTVLAVLVASAASAQPAPWKEAAPGRPVILPADHASHPDYRLEWWYYTGNLDAADGRRFGYQLTFFRVGVDPAPANPSRWAVRDLFMTHLALTDLHARHHHFTERLNRSGPAWAGASSDTYRVWNEAWQATLAPGGVHRLEAQSDGFGVDLRVLEDRPPVLHGEGGYSRKGSAPGNASYYYSLTRMPTRGTVTVNGRAVEVTGQSWMDHEFGTSFLEDGQVGWDWLSIQLEDGRDLMIFQLRRADGSVDPRSSGTLVDMGPKSPRGARAPRSTPITLDSGFRLEPGRVWTSPASQARYPVTWRVHVPSARLDLTVTAAVDAQELHTGESTGVSYWEGVIDVVGQSDGRPVKGRGYLEMTGYSGSPMSSFLR